MKESEEPSKKTGDDHQPVRDVIDLEALAKRVYSLLKEEARVERERLGRFEEG